MSRADQKAHTRQRIVEAAGRGFRRGGFGGFGVDGLAKEAGVTSGAFYVHFDSKNAAFREAVREGMESLRQGVLHFQKAHAKGWWPAFVRFYLGDRRTCELAESCALQTLSPDVGRSDDASRDVFEAGLRSIAEVIVAGPRSAGAPRDVDAALVSLSSLIGAVTLGRAVKSAGLSNQIAESMGHALLGAAWRKSD